PEFGDVAGAAFDDVQRDALAGGLFERVDQFQHAGAAAGAEVDGFAALPSAGERQCADVGVGQVHDVQVVAHAGAVDGGVVIAEDLQALTSANGDLGDVGHQVVGGALLFFADAAAGMGADRVEVAQQDGAELGLRGAPVFDQLL